jgi:hypothetical protein
MGTQEEMFCAISFAAISVFLSAFDWRLSLWLSFFCATSALKSLLT